MRINEIAPGEKEELMSSMEASVELIQTKCSDALTAVKAANHFIYRGFKSGSSKNSTIFHAHSRANRRSLSGSERLQSIVDQRLLTAGFKALRRNSIFCTGRKATAQAYGALYIVFPVNGFNLTWSPRLRDLVSSVETTDVGIDFVTDYEFFDNNLAAGISLGKELYISGEYYAFPANTYGSFFSEKFEVSTL